MARSHYLPIVSDQALHVHLNSIFSIPTTNKSRNQNGNANFTANQIVEVLKAPQYANFESLWKPNRRIQLWIQLFVNAAIVIIHFAKLTTAAPLHPYITL
jgi:hypothetical protein